MIFSQSSLLILCLLIKILGKNVSSAFPHKLCRIHQAFASRPFLVLAATPNGDDEGTVEFFASNEEKQKAVGNLVADDEWMGLTMELSELVRVAVIQDIKQNAREFLGKDDYKIGDVSKEIDSRVKKEVAQLRGKDEYELGDFVLAMDATAKELTEGLTGKPYQAGDLSVELDKRVKSAVADFCGKDEYEFGDLSREISGRVEKRVNEFVGKEYEFGDITRAIEERRRGWIKDLLGEEAAANYQFGDVTKKLLSGFTGKDDYQFGDVSKKILGDLFGRRKRGNGDK
jgi:hypothetical protein